MAASPGGVEVGRVSLRVVPDTSRLGPDLKVALDRIESQTDLTISTSIDTSELDAQARAAVEQAQLAAGDIDIKTNVDTSQVGEAERALSGASSAASAFSLGLGGLATAAIVLGPALIPLVAVIVALGAALVAPLAIVGGGLTVFGFLAAFAVKETNEQLKNITKLQTKLAGLTKGTAAYTETATELRNAQAALTPAQTAFGAALDNLKSSFDAIPKTIILGPITAGLNLLARILPLLTPVIKAVSGVLTDMLNDLDKAASSAGFKSFLSAFATQLGPDLRAFATIAGNVFTGLFGLFGAFNKQLSGSVLKSLENLTGKFATWSQTLGQSKGFKSFVGFIREVGPKVATALGGIADGATAIVIAFAPIGTTVLTIVGQLGHAIGKIPADVLVTLATALVTLVAAAKLLGPLQGLIAGVIAAPEVALAVGLIALLTGGFILLYQHSKPLRNLLGDLSVFFKTQLLPIMKNAAEKVVPALDSAFRDISKAIKENKGFLEVFGQLLLVFASAAVVTGILAVVAAIRVIGKYIAASITVIHAFVDIWLIGVAGIIRAFGLLSQAVLTVFGNILEGAADAFGWMPGIGGKVKAANAAFQSFRDTVSRDFDAAAARVDGFRHKIDLVGSPKPILVTVEDAEAVRHLEALQAFRLNDKSFKVTANLVERQVGPGGAAGHDPFADGGGTQLATPAPRSVQPDTQQQAQPQTTGRSAPLVNVEHMTTTDTTDILRKTGRALRGRAGGGVVLAGSN